MAPRSVIDLLAEQPEEALVAMREAVKAELARLEVESAQIEQALAKKSRRTRGSGKTGRLTREQVLDAVKRAGGPATAPQVHDMLVLEGATASLNSVRNHLGRLVEQNGSLIRLPDGSYLPTLTTTPSAADDIQF
jgi:hypothetical protein